MKKLFVFVEAFAFAAVTVGVITINPPTMQMMVAASQTANSPQASAVSLPGFDSPTTAVQENGAGWGRRQSRWLRTADGFAV
jgi:hypothetical protein